MCTFTNVLCLLSGNYILGSWTPLQLHGLREAEKGHSCSEKDSRRFQKQEEGITNMGKGRNFLSWGRGMVNLLKELLFCDILEHIYSKSSTS